MFVVKKGMQPTPPPTPSPSTSLLSVLKGQRSVLLTPLVSCVYLHSPALLIVAASHGNEQCKSKPELAEPSPL